MYLGPYGNVVLIASTLVLVLVPALVLLQSTCSDSTSVHAHGLTVVVLASSTGGFRYVFQTLPSPG
jgi:hypothetical protein